MGDQQQTDIRHFYVAGINYKKSDAQTRGLFAIQDQQYQDLLASATSKNMRELFVLSTCNRTEIYGFAPQADPLCELICEQTSGSLSLFQTKAYVKNGMDAIEHLFEVATGLDSQILGDYEIVGQLKQAVKISKQSDCLGTCLERLINEVLQASKAVKTQTELSGGTVSVSFAAIQYLKAIAPDCSAKNILLVGTGKIGRNTCKNLVDYLHTHRITLINRSEEKASELATALGLKSAPYRELSSQIASSDIIFVATNAPTPVILKEHLEGQLPKIIFDLSIPNNVAADTAKLPNVTLVNVDQLSQINDHTLQLRMAEIPKAKAIIQTHIQAFLEWQQLRRHVPVLKAVKHRLEQLQYCHLFQSAHATSLASHNVSHSQQQIQKVINGMAVKMQQQDQRGCYYIEAINEFMATGTKCIA